MSDLLELLKSKKIIVCCGSGGVGKTTVSAALALQAAVTGKRSAVLTIDPAKRLANALGMEKLKNKETEINPQLFKEFDLSIKGKYYALTLDTKRTFDEIIDNFSPSDRIRDRIYENKIYKILTDALSGTQEYMALEKLHELAGKKKFDVIILDTPPSRNALEFLKAPARLSQFMTNNKFFRIFLSPGMSAGRWGLKILSFGGSSVMKVLEKATGAELIKDIAEFFQNFEELIEGFGTRADEIEQLMKSSKTAFILVSTADAASLKEMNFFKDKLTQSGYPFGGLIVNRMLPDLFRINGHSKELENLTAGKTDVDEFVKRYEKKTSCSNDCSLALKSLADMFLRHQKRAESDKMVIKNIRSELPDKYFLKTIPLFEKEVSDIQGLTKITQALFNSKKKKNKSPA